jgi:uncharacterized protein
MDLRLSHVAIATPPFTHWFTGGPIGAPLSFANVRRYGPDRSNPQRTPRTDFMPSTDTPRLVLFARFPTPGVAKTRLIPALGARGAADVHRRLTERTVQILLATGLAVEIRYTGGTAQDFAGWLGDGITLVEQAEGDLSDKLIAAIEPTPVIFFGADTPELSVDHVHAAVAAMRSNPVVIGPAGDGGYYLIGLTAPLRFLFEAMPWSTEQVYPETLARLRARSIEPANLDVLNDCDRPEDLACWPWLTS